LSSNRKAILFTLSALSVCVVNIACESTPTDAPPDAPPRPALSYAQLHAGHAARIAPIDQFWSRSVMEIRWTDEDGDRHFEQGDGPLIVRPPNELALAIGKLGNTRFWLGGNAERYWLFDLAGDERIAYVGKQSQVTHAARQVLPLPIRPDQLIGLLDITPLPSPDAVADDVLITRDGDDHVILLPPEERLAGLMRKLRIDDRHRVTQIELMDRRGRMILTADLSRFARMDIEGMPSGGEPYVAQRIHITIGAGEDATAITLFARSATQGKNKVKDQQFDFDTLVKALKIDRVIDVDQPTQP